MNANRIDTVIVGGGQAGLAMSYYLKQEGREHVVLERAPAVGNAWRNQRWDSFTLVTPNFQVRMPGAEYQGNDPYGFMLLADVVKYFDDYVERFDLPVHCNVEVHTAEQTQEGYLVGTSEGNYEAENVVIATGLYQSPKIPKVSEGIPVRILQIHSMEYKNPSSLPAGAVLVVGTGQSGAQIAEELYQSGRKVYLSVGSGLRVPRRYRGKDINDWFTRMGLFDTKVEELKSPRDKFAYHPQISGKNGGHSLNLHQFYRDGVVLLGHVRDARDGKLIFARDLYETLAKIDQFEAASQESSSVSVKMPLISPRTLQPVSQNALGGSYLVSLSVISCKWHSLLWHARTPGWLAAARGDHVSTDHRESGMQGPKFIDRNAHRIAAVGHDIGQPAWL